MKGRLGYGKSLIIGTDKSIVYANIDLLTAKFDK